MRAVIALVLMTTPAFACDDPLFACTMAGKARMVQVCQTDTGFSYSYGKRGEAPELMLAEPFSAGTYTPWPGVSRTIWDSIAFRNAGFTYEVWTSIERGPGDADRQGGITILKGDAVQTTLSCAKGSITARIDDAYSVMEAAGYCQDDASRQWVTPCP